MQHNLQLQLHWQVHAPVAFDPVAGAAEQLQILDMIRPALALRDDVIHLKMSCLEVRIAAHAMPLVFAVEFSKKTPPKKTTISE